MRRRRQADEADEVATVLRACVAATATAEVKAGLERIDRYLAAAPKLARLRGSRGLQRAVTDALAGEDVGYERTRRLVALAGALWHGSALVPPAFASHAEAIAMWPLDGRCEYAVACARIGGSEAARTIARLVKGGAVPPDGAWTAAARTSNAAAAIVRALAQARSELPPDDAAAKRLAAAEKALAR